MSALDNIRYMKPFAGTIAKGVGLFFSGDMLEAASDDYLKRDRLPEPFDLPDHIGNLREAAMVTVAAFGIAGIFTLTEKTREMFHKSAKQTAVAAFVVSSVVQLAGEGLELSNDIAASNAGDMVDASWGIGGSALIAAGAYQVVTSLVESRHRQP